MHNAYGHIYVKNTHIKIPTQTHAFYKQPSAFYEHTLYSTYLVQYIPCTVHTLYSTYLVQYIPYTVHTLYSTYLVQYIPCTELKAVKIFGVIIFR